MAGSRLEKLMFTIGLVNKVSGPAGKIARDIDNLTSRASAGYAKVGMGAAGLFATGYALKAVLGPIIEMDRALGEVRSLNVRQESLDKLEKASLRFSIKYGESATEFVRASYDIQSAISGLTGNELAGFTNASAVLAKATKSDSATITDYVGTMYGIFQKTANQIGKAKWVRMLAGQTASAVQMFKTTGSEMSAAFVGLGAEGQSLGVSMSEQLSILGTLQATMSGSEAATKYKSFLQGVGKAQGELGLKFTDSQGKILPMVDILNKIKGKFGDIDTVAKSDILKKAFGTKEAVGLIKLLSTNISGLAGNIDALGNVSGMEKAERMARAMVDPWQQLAQVGVAVKTVFGRVMSPVLLPLIDSIVSGGESIIRWTELFPNLTRVVGIGVLVMFSLVAAISAFSLASGIASLSMSGFSAIMVIGHGAMMLFNAALWANPVTWVVAGIIALVAAVAGLIIYWDEITAALDNSVIFQVVRLAFQAIAGAVSLLWDGVMLIISGWKLLFDVFGVTAAFNGVISLFGLVGDGIGAVTGGIGWLIDKFLLFSNIAASVLKGIADNGLFKTISSLFGGSVDVETKVTPVVDPMPAIPIATKTDAIEIPGIDAVSLPVNVSTPILEKMDAVSLPGKTATVQPPTTPLISPIIEAVETPVLDAVKLPVSVAMQGLEELDAIAQPRALSVAPAQITPVIEAKPKSLETPKIDAVNMPVYVGMQGMEQLDAITQPREMPVVPSQITPEIAPNIPTVETPVLDAVKLPVYVAMQGLEELDAITQPRTLSVLPAPITPVIETNAKLVQVPGAIPEIAPTITPSAPVIESNKSSIDIPFLTQEVTPNVAPIDMPAIDAVSMPVYVGMQGLDKLDAITQPRQLPVIPAQVAPIAAANDEQFSLPFFDKIDFPVELRLLGLEKLEDLTLPRDLPVLIDVEKEKRELAEIEPTVPTRQTSIVPPGGLLQAIQNTTNNSQQNKRTSIDNVTIHTAKLDIENFTDMLDRFAS